MQLSAPTSIRMVLWISLFLSYSVLAYLVDRNWQTNVSLDRNSIYFLLFFGLLDAPHVFLTSLRSHFDSDEWNRRRYFHSMGFLFCIGATLIVTLIGQWERLLVVLQYLGSFHIFRQNVLFHRMAMQQEHIDKRTYAREDTYFPCIMAFAWISPFFIGNVPMEIALLINVGVILFFRSVFKIRFRERNLYMTCAQILTFYIFASKMNPAAAIFIETLYHAIQYLAFMWAFQTRRELPVKNYLMLYMAGLFIGFMAEGTVLGGFIRQIMLAGLFGVYLYHFISHDFIWNLDRHEELFAIRDLKIFRGNPFLEKKD